MLPMLKWIQIKDLAKIEKRKINLSLTPIFIISANPELLNGNHLKAWLKASFLSLMHISKDKLSNSESMANSKAKDKLDKKTNLFSKILATETNSSQR